MNNKAKEKSLGEIVDEEARTTMQRQQASLSHFFHILRGTSTNNFSGDHLLSWQGERWSALSPRVTDSFKLGCSAAIVAFLAAFCFSDTRLPGAVTLN